MLKFVVLGIVLFAVVKLFRGDKKKLEAENTTEEKAKDMVACDKCETFTESDTDFKVKYYDKVYRFCSKDCMDSFIEEKKGENS